MPPRARVDELSDSDDEWDELVSQDGSDDEDVKPSQALTAYLKGSLPEPRFKTVNLRQLHEYIHTGDVDLDPEYQRAVVWPVNRQERLISSLFLNFYVPPVIFAIKLDDEGNERRVCIDGKQRCTSIKNFIDGGIPYRPPGSAKKFWYQPYPNQKGGEPLPPQLRRKFDNISIQVVEYDDLDMNQQRDIFQRVQLGMPLSTAEKMAALPGPWGVFISHLVKKYVTEPGTLGQRLPQFDQKRARPFQVITGFIIMAYESPREPVPTAPSSTAFLERTSPPEKSFEQKIEMCFAIFVQIATDYYQEAFGNLANRVAPVEFDFILLLIYRRMNTMSVARLANEIASMRAKLREKHRDIRSNAAVMGDLYAYLNTVPAGKLPGEIAAREEFHGDTVSESQMARLKKRNREEDDDETYHGDGPGRFEESAVAGSLRSKKKKTTNVKTEPNASPPKRPTTAVPAAGPSAAPIPAPQQAYVPRIQPQAAVRPAPIGMDAPMASPGLNRGPAPQPPYGNGTGYNPNHAHYR